MMMPVGRTLRDVEDASPECLKQVKLTKQEGSWAEKLVSPERKRY